MILWLSACPPWCCQTAGTDEDRKAVLEMIFAAYESAGTGRKVALPFTPPTGKKPVELWLR